MDCGNAECPPGEDCIENTDDDVWFCAEPCTTDGDCMPFVSVCTSGTQHTVGAVWCGEYGECTGIIAITDCTDMFDTPCGTCSGAGVCSHQGMTCP
jgi:hypothetical protein